MRVAAWCESLSFLDWCESLCPRIESMSSAEGMSQTMARENSLISFSKKDASDSSLSSNCQTLTNEEKKKTLIEHNLD